MIWWTGLAPWEFGFPFPGSGVCLPIRCSLSADDRIVFIFYDFVSCLLVLLSSCLHPSSAECLFVCRARSVGVRFGVWDMGASTRNKELSVCRFTIFPQVLTSFCLFLLSSCLHPSSAGCLFVCSKKGPLGCRFSFCLHVVGECFFACTDNVVHHPKTGWGSVEYRPH